MYKVFLKDVLLPVNPIEEITFSTKTLNETKENVNLVEINLLSGRGLLDIKLSSLFPRYTDSLGIDFAIKQPSDYILLIQKAMEESQPISFIIIGENYDLNLKVSIESFDYTEKAGEIGEFYYDLALKEYREPTVTNCKIEGKTSDNKLLVSEEKERPDNRSIPKEYTVKKGDTLWGIAKAQLGDGSKYPELGKINNMKSPYYLNVGQKIKLS